MGFSYLIFKGHLLLILFLDAETVEYFKNKTPKIIDTFLNTHKLTVILEMFTRFFGSRPLFKLSGISKFPSDFLIKILKKGKLIR